MQQKNNISLIGEADYAERVKNEVQPVLKANRKDGYFYSRDNTKIFYNYYLNPEAKASIVISHGFCEFTAKFDEVVYYFFEAGYSVFIFDYRGHGYSERFVSDLSKVHIDSYDEYLDDLESFITKIVKKYSPQKKLLLYGHSMGGAIAALFLERFPEVFSCAILSSPMLEMNFGTKSDFFVLLLMYYSKIFHFGKRYVQGQSGFDGVPDFEGSGCLSKERYEDIFSKRIADKNYYTFGATRSWVLASIKAIKYIQRHKKNIKTPILLFQAEYDNMVKPGGQNMFVDKSKNAKLVIIRGSKHEIYNADKKIREEYYNQIFDFLEVL